MSSLTYANGKAEVQVMIDNGRRRTIRFGKCSKTQAKAAQDHVNALEERKNTGSVLRLSTAEWLVGLPGTIYSRIEKTGLVRARERKESPTVEQWFSDFIAGREGAKPATLVRFDQIKKKVVGYFGKDKRLDEITPSDAEDFGFHLRNMDKALSEGYIRRMCGLAKQIFRKAVKKRLIAENPFDDIKCSNFSDPNKFHYVSREDAEKVLRACPDREWRLIFALCRYGALRCPSEIHRLTWADIDWEQDRFTVHAVKTEHHEGGGVRIVPIFPELYPILEEVFRKAEPGTQYVITRHRDSNQYLRKQFIQILHKASMKPWKKIFVNLRASRAIELNETFPGHVVSKWLGHSERVERQHYLNVTEDHFKKAVQNPMQPPVELGAMECNTETENCVCKPITADSNLLHEMDLGPMGGTGFEPVTSRV
jgi:integrase